jgi:hypothetical protein
MLNMTTASSRILLVADAARASADPHASKVRRYRLARVRLAERRNDHPARHPHLTRAYD